eukprot:TRINITY_DN4231_c0_g1_i2.p1 TRINITY_DN4231_c0_g1~~TRINITY_DN4231_c0_g1_i2.p1  ORF type:complete len:516 (-),score=110.34 TRINITY_DN4231_c0_g1_i2:83-1630(-)
MPKKKKGKKCVESPPAIDFSEVPVALAQLPFENFDIGRIQHMGKLYIKFVEAVGVLACDVTGTSDPYCVFYLGDDEEEALKTSVIYTTLNPVWNEEYVLNCTTIAQLLNIYMWDQDNIGKDDFMGYCGIDLRDLIHGREVREMLKLSSNPKKNKKKEKDRGTLNLALHWFPYSRIVKLICVEDSPVMRLFCESFKTEEFARALVSVCGEVGCLMNISENILKKEVEETLHAQTLFRGDSLGTKLQKAVCHLYGLDWIDETIGDLLREFNDNPGNFEVDETRLEPGYQNIESNRNFLRGNVMRLIEAVESGLETCPIIIRQLCATLKNVVGSKFPDASTSSIGGFVFLRFICPVIFQPDQFGFVENLNDEGRRHLVLLAKIIQNISNGVHFKQPAMQVFDTFVDDLLPRFDNFLNNMANVSEDVIIPKLPEDILMPQIDVLIKHFMELQEVDTKVDDLYGAFMPGCDEERIIMAKKNISMVIGDVEMRFRRLYAIADAQEVPKKRKKNRRLDWVFT